MELHAAKPANFGPRKIGSPAYWHAFHRLIVSNALIGQVPAAGSVLALVLVGTALRVLASPYGALLRPRIRTPRLPILRLIERILGPLDLRVDESSRFVRLRAPGTPTRRVTTSRLGMRRTDSYRRAPDLGVCDTVI